MPQIPQISGPFTGGKTLTSGNNNTPQNAEPFSIDGVNAVQRPTGVTQRGDAAGAGDRGIAGDQSALPPGLQAARDPSMAVETLHDVFSGELLENAKLNGYTELVGEIDDLTKAIYINPDKLMNEILTQEKDNTVFAGNQLFEILRELCGESGEDTKDLIANLLKSLNYAMSRNEILDAVKSNIKFLAEYFGKNTTLSKSLYQLYDKWNSGDPAKNFEELKNETAALMRTISGSLQNDSRTETLVPLVTHNLSRYNTNEYMMKEAFTQLMSQVPKASMREALNKAFTAFVSKLLTENTNSYNNNTTNSVENQVSGENFNVSAEKAAVLVYLSKLLGGVESGNTADNTINAYGENLPAEAGNIEANSENSSEASYAELLEALGESPEDIRQAGVREQPVAADGRQQPVIVDERGQPVAVDERGQPVAVDERGQPVAVDERGLPVLVDEKGQPVVINEEGQPVFVNDKGQPVIINDRGQPVVINEKGQPVMTDEKGQPVVLDERGQPVAVNEKGQPVFISEKGQPVIINEKGQPVIINEKGEPIVIEERPQPFAPEGRQQPVTLGERDIPDNTTGQRGQTAVGERGAAAGEREMSPAAGRRASETEAAYKNLVPLNESRIAFVLRNYTSGLSSGRDAIDQLLNLLIPRADTDVAETMHTVIKGTDNLTDMVNFLNRVLENIPDIPERQTLCDAFERIINTMARDHEMPAEKSSGYESETVKALTSFIERNVNHPAIRGIDNFNASNLLQSILNAPGVFTPLAHYIIPLQVEDTRAFGELWVDNDNTSGKNSSENGEKSYHLFLTFDVEAVGRFEVDAYSAGKELNLSVLYPKSYRYRVSALTDKITKIAAGVGFNVQNFKTGILIKPHSLAETFPRIKENRRSFDVKA